MDKHLSLKVMLSVILACLLGLSAFAQNAADETVVKGIVTDKSNNEPLIGAIVWVKDTPHNAITGIDGDYELSFTGNYGFVTVSLMGYKDVDIQVRKGTQTINVALEPDGEMLEEAVAVGYGTQKKVSVVGAITTIEPDALKVPVSKLSNALSGRLAGVVSIQRSGEPGAGSEFWIRGIGTFGENANPLILVDGIERELDLVDVEDIKEFSILKDAAATAVYGVRGANGVVLITTRSGEEGKPKISIKHESGLVTPTKVPEMASGAQFMEMYNDAYGMNYYTPEYIQNTIAGTDPYLYPNVDWVNEVFKKFSSNTRTNLSVNGGTNTVKYFVSGGFYNENGLFREDPTLQYNTGIFYRKFNFRANVDIQLFEHTSMSVKLATTFEQTNQSGNQTGTIWNYALITPAIVHPVKFDTEEGTFYAGDGTGMGQNPVSLLTQSGYRQGFTNNAQTVFGLDHDFSWLLDGLKGNAKVSFDANNYHWQTRTRNPEQYSATGRDENGNIILKQNDAGSQTLSFGYGAQGWRALYLEASLNYARSFGRHGVTGLFLFQQSSKNYVGSLATNSQAALPYRNQGIAFRATYNYDSKYFLEFNAGYNGSENFSPGHRFGFFPSVAAGWLVSDEPWWQPVKNVISMLKFKGSYGLVGNDKIGGGRRFIYLETINNGGSYNFGTSLTSEGSLRMGEWPNEEVGWETSRKLDVGFDVEFFNALKINFDYFHEYRTGIFLQRKSIPYFAGITSTPWSNVGEMRNSGFDASMTYDQQVGEVHLSALANFTFTRNVILNMDEPTRQYPYMAETGQARWQKFGLVSDGLFQSYEDIASSPDQSYFGDIKPGDIKYKDLNGDGKIDAYDVKPIGYCDYPEIVYGFGLNAQWKGFDASVFFQGIDHVNFSVNTTLVRGFTGNQINSSNVFSEVYGNYWTEDNPNAKYPRLTVGKNTNNSQSSDFWMVDGAYLRLKNVEFGYTLPKKLTTKMKISNLRVFLSGTNLLTFSKFKLWDPDLQTGATNYPNNKTFNIGLNLAF